MYKKSVYFLRSAGTCIAVVGGCWFCYQLRRTSQLLSSVVDTNVLDLERTRAQYIYIDDPRLQDVLLRRGKEDLSSTIVEGMSPNLRETITTWWKSLNRILAYRFLHVAQNGSLIDRQKAVSSLGCLKHLKDWDYWQIAQMLDARTAVALARTPNVDLRYFLKPPFWRTQHAPYDIIENLRQLLIELDKICASCHRCLSQFLEKNFRNKHREGLLFDHDVAVGLPATPKLLWNQTLLESCVQAVHHHSSLDEHSKDIADVGGLKLLMEVQKYYGNDVNICILLAKILSNLSLSSQYLEDIYALGWIGVLARWAQHKDVRLSAPAGRALANLDADDNATEKYPRRIYLLHPLHKTRSSTKLDVVFIHGLLGGVFFTWRQRDLDLSTLGLTDSASQVSGLDSMVSMTSEQPQEFLKDLAHDLEIRDWKRLGQDFDVVLNDCPENMNFQACGPFTCKGDDVCMAQEEQDRVHRTQCWPRDWLPKDIPSLRIIGVNYDTNLSMWTPYCPIEGVKATIKERSDELMAKLVMAGVGKRPVIWVCHSMGGLLVKKMLVQESKTNDRNGICKNTRGIVFYSTPHRGSHVAALKQTTQMFVWPSVEVQELREGSPQLLELHNDFLKLLEKHPMDIISFSETKSTLVTALRLPLQFVNPTSSDPGVGEFFAIPQDHLSICKPANRQSFLYQKLVSVIKRHLHPQQVNYNTEN